MRAGLCGSSKSRNRASWARMPATFVSICSRDEQHALLRLAAGIADHPGPATHHGNRRVPGRCSRAKPRMVSNEPT